MLSEALQGKKLSKAEYKKRVPKLRASLLRAQESLREEEFPLLILVSGADGAGKGSTVNLLNEWLDPRYVRTRAFKRPNEYDQLRPPFWRFWKALPAKGTTAIFIGSWYSEPIFQFMNGHIDNDQFMAELQLINEFERSLVDNGIVLLKYWLHMSKKDQEKRLEKLVTDPDNRWRVSGEDWHQLEVYEQFTEVAELTLQSTQAYNNPWQVVDGGNKRYRDVAIGESILTTLDDCVSQHSSKTQTANPVDLAPIVSGQSLADVNLTQQLSKEVYKKELKLLQAKLGKLSRQALKENRGSVIVMEGWDAAGKGGLIRRITPGLDARSFQVIPIAAPTDVENAHHYLWRFWLHVPQGGNVTIFDRSWYGRVLVERIEEFTPESLWKKGYREINEFEQHLTDHGITVVKFWVHIDADEQLRRFKERETISHKQYKITEEDYRNRNQWKKYESAVNEMVARTSTGNAPWHLIAGNDKYFARVQALRIYCEQLEKSLNASW